MEWRYWESIRKAVRLVQRFYPDYALIGRFARNFYAPPETTLDIDFLVNLDDRITLEELIDFVGSQSYEISPTDVGHWQYKMNVKGFRVDLVKPKGFHLDEEFIFKRRLVRLRRVGRIFVSSPEDLATLYVVSSRERGVRDLVKAKDVIEYSRARNDFNEDYFLSRCERNSVKPLCLELLQHEPE